MTYAVFDGTYQEAEYTGQSRVSYELLRATVGLVGAGKCVERLAVATFSGHLSPDYAIGDFPIVRMGLEPHIAAYGNALGLFNLARRLQPKPDVVYWHTPVRFCRDVPGIRQVVMVHDLLPLRLPKAFPRRAAWLMKAAMTHVRNSSCRVLSISEVTKADVVALADICPERVKVVHNGVSDDFRVIEDEAKLADTARRLGLEGKRYLLFVGRPTPRKNIPMLTQVFLEARRATDQPLHLVLVGPGHDGVDRITRKLGCTAEERQAVVPLSRISDDDLVAVYNLAWAMVFPSTHEGFGLPVLEAMACGTPVISSDCSSIPEVAGNAAILLDPARPQQWVDAIVALLEDEAQWQELRRLGFKQAATKTWKHAAKAVLDVLGEK